MLARKAIGDIGDLRKIYTYMCASFKSMRSEHARIISEGLRYH